MTAAWEESPRRAAPDVFRELSKARPRSPKGSRRDWGSVLIEIGQDGRSGRALTSALVGRRVVQADWQSAILRFHFEAWERFKDIAPLASSSPD